MSETFQTGDGKLELPDGVAGLQLELPSCGGEAFPSGFLSLFNLKFLRDEIEKAKSGNFQSIVMLRLKLSVFSEFMPVSLLLRLSEEICKHRKSELQEESEGN